MTPLGDRIIVRPFPHETRFGSLYIPESKEKPIAGEIIAVGPGKRDKKGVLQAMHVKAGQKVMFGKYAPQLFEHNGEKLMSMSQMDVLFIME